MNIKNKDITVVVQGAIDEKFTPLVLKSIRKSLKGSKIILSTWEGADIENLDYDEVILNKDVGPNICLDGSSFNIGRQIFSTIEGLKRVKTKYAIKVRSTCIIKDSAFIKYFDCFNEYNHNYKFFKNRIIVPSFYTVLGKGNNKYSDIETHYMYEVSDWFYFGLTEDLIKLFDIPLPPNKHEYTLYNKMSNHELLLTKKNKPGAQYLDQQYIFVQSLLKAGKEIHFKDWTDVTYDSRLASRQYILNNFIVLDYKKELNIEDLKYKNSPDVEKAFVYNKWLKLYYKYCLGKKIVLDNYLMHYVMSKICSIKNFCKDVIQDIKLIAFTKIHSKDISVIVQGAIDRKYIYKTLKSIRKFLPNAEIILSTWEGTDVSGLDYDILQLNEDPGAEVFTPSGKRQNQNRQILSTQNGIKLATRKYVLKLRSDMQIKGTKFLTYFGKYKKRNDECKILKERVLINSLYTRKPLYTKVIRGEHILQPYLFHVSDWMMFGLREDMINIWDIPLAPEPETSQYFVNHPDLPHDKGCLTRWHAEQYIWLEFLKKNGINHNYENYWIYDKNYERLSELSIVNNTTLLEYKKEFDILCQKYTYQFGDSETMHPYDWFVLYQKFCDKDFVIPFKYTLIQDFHLAKYLAKLNKQWSRVKNFCKTLFNIFAGLAGVIYYILHIIFNLVIFTPKFIVKVIRRIFSR